jgi:hypothetical protein
VSLPQALEPALGKAVSAIPWIAFTGNVLVPTVSGLKAMIEVLLILPMVWFMPNIAELFQRYRPTFESQFAAKSATSTRKTPTTGLQRLFTKLSGNLAWQPSMRKAVMSGVLLFGALMIIGTNHKSEFLYFQF